MKNLSEAKDINLPEISPRSALEEVLPDGARRLLQEDIEQEVLEYVQQFKDEKRCYEQTPCNQKWVSSFQRHPDRNRSNRDSPTSSKRQAQSAGILKQHYSEVQAKNRES